MELWIAGNTVPDARANGMLCQPPRGGWPQAGSLSPDEARDYVYEFLKSYQGSMSDLIPDSEKDRVALIYGWGDWGYTNSNVGAATVLAAVYLTLCLVGRPLPEDFEGDVSPTAAAWPDPGDNNGRLIYAWDFHIDEWHNYIPKLRTRQAMQVQKWSNKDQVWKVFNQWGSDLVFYFDPKANTWSASFDMAEWLTEHGKLIFDAFQAVYGAAASFFGVSLQVAAVQNAFKALAEAAASNDPNRIAGALANAFTAVAGVPGGADALNQLSQAGKSITTDVLHDVVAVPLVANGISIVSSAAGDTAKIVAQADMLRKQLNIADPGIAKAAAQAVANIRTQLVPPYLQPWFDKAVKLGAAGANITPPFYAQGIWNLGTTYGVLLGEGAGQHGASGIRSAADLYAPNASAYAGISLHQDASILYAPTPGALGFAPARPIAAAAAGVALGALSYFYAASPFRGDKRVAGGAVAVGILAAILLRKKTPPLPNVSSAPPPIDQRTSQQRSLLNVNPGATSQVY